MDMPRSVAECIDTAARFLAAQPGAVQRTLASHRPRPDGYCGACRPLVRWPCTMVAIARVATGHPVASRPQDGAQG